MCIAIAIDIGLSNTETIPYFIDRDINKPNPKFEPFKNVYYAWMEEQNYEECMNTLQLIEKYYLHFYILSLVDEAFSRLCQVDKESFAKLKVERLYLFDLSNPIIESETIELINQLNLCTLETNCMIQSFEYLRALFSLNCTNLRVEIYRNYGFYDLTFSKTTILFLDQDNNQRLYLECESVTFLIEKEGINDMLYLNSEDNNYLSSDYIFISLESVSEFLISKFKIIPSCTEFTNLLTPLNAKVKIMMNGFLIPYRNLSRTSLNLKENQLINYIISNQNFICKLMKAKHINCEIKFIDDLFTIKKMFPYFYSNINYSFSLQYNNQLKRANTLDDIDLDEFCFYSIDSNSKCSSDVLDPKEQDLVFNSIYLNLKFLSECLLTLEICENCPELNNICLRYDECDVEEKDKSIDKAIRNFTKKVGIITRLEISS